MKGEFIHACKYISLELHREQGRDLRSHFRGEEVKEVICGTWEIGARPLSFTQIPLSLKPVREGQKALFHKFLGGD